MHRRLASFISARWVFSLAVAAAACGESDQGLSGSGGPPRGPSAGSGGIDGSSGSGGAGTAGGTRGGSSGAGGGGQGGSAGSSGSGGVDADAGNTGGRGGGSAGTGGGSVDGAAGASDAGGRDASVIDDGAVPPCSGDRCICMPGERRECYSGPPATKGVGLCIAGSQTCSSAGTEWGACTGEVVPRTEDCASPQDEDCDGRPGCFVVDLRADVNRNGTIDVNDPSEDAGEDTWDATHGAIFLPNIDDDMATCSRTAADATIAQCNDAADEVTNGADDLLDLARLRVMPLPSAAMDATGKLSLDAKSTGRVRLFKRVASGFTVFDPATAVLTATELREGVEFAIEGKDVLRDATTWNGYADVTLTVKPGLDPSGNPAPDVTDTVRLRQAPVIFRHHLSPVETLYVTASGGTGYQPFITSLNAAITATGTTPLQRLDQGTDQWTQDIFEPAYVSMPAAGGGQHVIHVNVRSANYGGSKGPGLRPAGRVVFTVLRGKNVAGVQQYDTAHANNMDTLNSTGNFETIPPYINGNERYPLGRVLRGSTAAFYPDKSMDQMIDAQGQQTILTIDTSWLLVAHVDETVSFMKAATPHGFIMLVNDPTAAVKMLQDQKAAGLGTTAVFAGTSGATTIDAILANTAIMSHNQEAAVDIQAQVDVIKAATGLTDAEIVRVPVLHRLTSSRSVAHTPGTVNGIAMNDKTFFAPEPHGPVIAGRDIFKANFETAMSTWGITVRWVEDWDLYHRLDGEIHCATNAARSVTAGETWWTSGK